MKAVRAWAPIRGKGYMLNVGVEDLARDHDPRAEQAKEIILKKRSVYL
jgi:hypothetical protein